MNKKAPVYDQIGPGYAGRREADPQIEAEDLELVNSDPRVHLVDRLDHRLVNVLTVLGFALPAVGYFWFIHQYGVNMIWGDQWHDVGLISQSHSHTLGLGTLWAQWTDNRIFFPNLIVLLLAYTTHFNVVFEEYVSGVMLVVAAGLVILAHKRRAPSTPWLYYCPVAILMLSFVGGNTNWAFGGNTLFGFQMCWYLTMLALAAAVFLLDRPALTWLAASAAIVVAVVGSFSSLQGLLIWPTGLVLLLMRHRDRDVIVAWIVSAVVTAAIYFHNFIFGFSTNTGNTGWVLSHPVAAMRFFVYAIGNLLGMPTSGNAANKVALLLGLVVLIIAIWIVITQGFRRDEESGSAIGVTLICFGLLFDATITAGRADFGLAQASRYATFEMLIGVGCYLALLDRPTSRTTTRSLEVALGRVFRYDPNKDLTGPSTTHVRGTRRRDALTQMMLAILVFAVVLQVVWGTGNGLTFARSWHATEIEGAGVMVNIDKAPDALVERALFPSAYADTVSIRNMTHFLSAHHLSLFATGAVARYKEASLPNQPSPVPPTTRVLVPLNGAEMTGTEGLLAIATDNFGVTKVEFRLTGGRFHDRLIGVGTQVSVGLAERWNTTNVPNGIYTLQSVAYSPTGMVTYSPGITVVVENK